MKNNQLKVSAFGLVLLLAHAAAAQRTAIHPISLEVHGQVRYTESRAPAANILVRLETFSGGVTGQMLTDRQGKFTFSGLASMQYVLTIHAPGYHDVTQSVDLLTATSDFVYAYLVPAANSREKTTVGYVDANVPEKARKEFEKGQAAVAEKKPVDVAAPHFQNAINLYPAFFEAELSLGTLYMDAGQWDKAEQALRRALEINSKVPNAFFAFGELNLQQKHYREAETALIQGLKLQDRSWQGHFTLGRVYWQTGELPKAGRHVALAIQLNPTHAPAHLLGANILLRAGKREDAISEFEEFLRLDPKGTHSNEARMVLANLKRSKPNDK
ncbi:MAG TPA: tetratricopeptide repeat protein [Pyrinomonadaceae bacterium]|jgi:tetratricopeptide (TPR) repeat protein